MMLLSTAFNLSLVIFVMLPNNPAPWQKVKDSDNLTIYIRPVAHSNIQELKAETTIDAAAERIWAVLAEIEQYHEFMPHLAEARPLAEVGPHHERLEYFRLKPPFVRQRDYVIKVETSQDPSLGRYVRRWSTINDRGPKPRQDAIRLAICNGSWTLQRLNKQQTQVIYWLHTDPAGRLPSWLVNQANTHSIPEMLEALRQRTKDPSWTR